MFGLIHKREILSFNRIILTIKEMGTEYEYEIRNNGTESEILLFRTFYSADSQRMLEKSTVCDTKVILKMLNDYNAAKWDGFDGEHPAWVRDGRMFMFTVEIDEEKKIMARGSQNFPKGYHGFEKALETIINTI